MKLKRKSSDAGGISPEATAILKGNFSEKLYFTERNTRHPAAIYSTSWARILSRFEKVLADLQVTQDNYQGDQNGNKIDTEFLESHESLLYSLMEHFDDCKSILECFISPDLKSAKNDGFKTFGDNAKEYRNYMGTLVNAIKHKQGRLRANVYFNNRDVFLGYFVEAILEDGAVGPNPLIHPNNTAISFARDIRYHLIMAYDVSRHLSNAIKKITSVDLSETENVETQNFVEVIEGIINFSPIFFISENDLKQPSIKLIKNNGEMELLMTYQKSNRKLKTVADPFLAPLTAATIFSGDGHTTKFRYPGH